MSTAAVIQLRKVGFSYDGPTVLENVSLEVEAGEFLGVVVNAVRSAAGGYMRKNIQTAHDYQTDPGEIAEPSAGPELKSA